jgi:GT2 family glycosyltransferase
MNSAVIREEFHETRRSPSISIIVVTYNAGDALLRCLLALAMQESSDFECIVVDNAALESKTLSMFDVRYFKLDKNYGPSYARNYGAQKARGSVVVFVDDDAVANRDYVAAWNAAFEDASLVSARGRVIPLTKQSVYNSLAAHYDLGDGIVGSAITTEGNCAVRKDAFLRVGGFNPTLYGHEGVELSYRLSGRGRQLYVPDAVVYHDYADSLRKLLRKNFRHGYNGRRFAERYPEVLEYVEGFHYIFLVNKETKGWWWRRGLRMVLIALSRVAEIIGSLAYVAGWKL